MAFYKLPSTAVTQGRAIVQELLNRIRLNFDDHESRVTELETASNTSGFIVGEIKPFAGSTLPSGFLWCDGSEVSKTTYADLWSALGSTHVYGTPPVDPTNNFLLPDVRGRMLCGLDDMNNSVGTGGGAASRVTSGASSIDGGTLGSSGGVETVTLGLSEFPSHDHDFANPAHSHGVTDPGHAHDWDDITGVGATPNKHNLAFDSSTTADGLFMDSNTTGISLGSSTHGITYNSQGDDDPHTNMPPSLILNAIIRTST